MSVASAPGTATAPAATGPILKVSGLTTELHTGAGIVRAVDDVSIELRRGETLGIVGESGCGKSMTALSIVGLQPRGIGRIVSGSIVLDGVGDLTRLSDREMRKVRGNDISMIFQEPMTSLNPVFTIGFQICEALRVHRNVDRSAARGRALEMLAKVGIPLPETRFANYPHQLSGGMRQRVMIAMALICEPKIMLADEPTTALDVTIQAQILNLMARLQRETGTAIILITHDLGVIARMVERVLVMYAGVVVEEAGVLDLFAEPLHPYTIGLMKSVLDTRPGSDRKVPLHTIRGSVPDLHALGTGCRFADRCPQVHARCRAKEPPLAAPDRAAGPGRKVRCWLHREAD